LCLLFLVGLLLLMPGGVNTDLWGHVQFGHDVFAEGLPATTTYSYTADGYPWINHENLCELWMAQMDSWVGGPGLQITRLVLAMLVVAVLLLRYRQQGLEPLLLVGCTLMGLMNLRYHWSIRPQLFTYTFFLLMLLVLESAFRGWDGHWNLPLLRKWARGSAGTLPSQRQLNWLWLIVPMMGVWANTHGGFLAGLLILYAVLGGRLVEMVFTHGRSSLPAVSRVVLIAIAAGGVTLINPYGHHLHSWLLWAMHLPHSEILEWRPLEWGQSFTTLYIGMAVLVAWGLLQSRRPLDACQLGVIALVFLQAAMHRRHIAFAALAFALWLPVHLQDAWNRLRQRYAPPWANNPIDQRGAWLGLVTCVGSLILLVLLRQSVQLWVPAAEYPLGATQFMARHGVGGRLMCTFNWSQYVLAAVCTDQRIVPATELAFDGRFTTCYPLEIRDLHFDFVLGNDKEKRYRGSGLPFQADGILSLGDPELVLVDRNQRHSLRVLAQRRDKWTLLYQDAMCQLWGRSSKYDDPHSPHYLSPEKRVLSNTKAKGLVPWPGLPGRDSG
jgi:hypothetical protein